ncbi:MAG: cell filamentation protein Fic [Gallionellaceae bacterium CG1_02_60_948]|nr:MAG: cell filamentation protein Fic [Gallionellaceae bacterium CG1_02_60_948]
MSPDDRYDVSGLSEAQFQPSSDGLVLKNLLGITLSAEMDAAEANALIDAVDRLVRSYDEEHRFTANDICELHRVWLGGIYAWAGEYRQVNVSKGNFMFAAAGRIPALMAEFERDALARCTPCKFETTEEIVGALAETHVELVLIHPFLEGNGRISRVLSTLMALQAGLPLLDFGTIAGEKKENYFAAVRAGLDRNYRPMEKIFSGVIERSVAGS